MVTCQRGDDRRPGDGTSSGSDHSRRTAAVGNWFGNPDLSTNSTALTADAPAGSVSITVANASIFTGGVGQIVLLDELSGAQWMPDNVPGNLADGYKIWAAADYRCRTSATGRLSRSLTISKDRTSPARSLARSSLSQSGMGISSLLLL